MLYGPWIGNHLPPPIDKGGGGRSGLRRVSLYGPDGGAIRAAVGVHIGGPALQFLFISGYAAMTVRKSLRRRDN